MINQTHVPAPGEYIREEISERGWSQRDLAFVLGVSEHAVSMIVSGKRGISANMARALAEAFGVSAELFMNLQSAYDLSKVGPADPSIARRARLYVYPVKEMIRRGWITGGDTGELEAQMTRFFCVDSVDEIPHIDPRPVEADE